jgi:hypothetical protein
MIIAPSKLIWKRCIYYSMKKIPLYQDSIKEVADIHSKSEEPLMQWKGEWLSVIEELYIVLVVYMCGLLLAFDLTLAF